MSGTWRRWLRDLGLVPAGQPRRPRRPVRWAAVERLEDRVTPAAFGASVAAGDLTGDRVPDLVIGAGAGGGPHVRVIDGATGRAVRSFLAGPDGDRGGVSVAAGDVNRDGIADIVAGAAGRVRVFDGRGGEERAGYDSPGTAAGPPAVAAGDVDADGYADVVIGAGPGGPPRVLVYSGRNGAVLFDRLVFGAGFAGGVSVAAGDVDADGRAEVIVGAGPGGGPHVRVLRAADGVGLTSFYAFASGFTGGVSVAAGDVEGDGRADLILAPRSAGGPHLRAVRVADGADLASFYAFAPEYAGGVAVGAADLDGDGRADLLAAARAGSPHVRAFAGASGAGLASFFGYDAADPGTPVAHAPGSPPAPTPLPPDPPKPPPPPADTTPPVVALSAPADGLLTAASPVVAGTAADAGGSVVRVRASVDGGPEFDVPFDPAGGFAFPLSLPLDGSADGPHTARVWAADATGNTSAPAAVTFTLDTRPPAVEFGLAPESDSAPAGDGQTWLTAVALVGRTEPGRVVVLAGSGRAVLAAADGRFRFDGVGLADGNNAFAAEAADAAGNVGRATVTVRRVPPPAGGPDVAAGLANDTGRSMADGLTADPAVRGTAAPGAVALAAGFGETPPAVLVDLSADLGPGGAFALSAARLAAVYGGPLPDGRLVLHLRATDAAGASGTARVAFTLDRAGPAAPALGLSAGSDTAPAGDGRTAAGRVTLVGTTDPLAPVTLSTGAATVADAGGAFRFPDVDLAIGANPLTARAVDAAGNQTEYAVTLDREAAAPAGDVVLDWNFTLLEAVRIDASTPPLASRNMAIVQGAVYDAVSAAEGTPGYFARHAAPAGASPVAAAAAAAHRALAYLYPAQRATFDAALAASLAQVPDGPAEDDGAAVGRAAADAVLAQRAGDGWDAFLDYVPGSGPGAWVPTPPAYAPALAPLWGEVRPFALQSADQFPLPGPPALDSPEWAAAYAEVKALGRATGSTRTPEQTQIARFWADGLGTYCPPGHWNQIAAGVARAAGNSLAANARLLAVLNVAMADAAIAAWRVKYDTAFWRPVTAVRAADADGNPDTTADPDWSSLLVTPNFPEYTSGHSTFSGAAAAVLDAAFGSDVTFPTDSVGLPGVTRTFTGFDAAASEASRSRVYGGIHYGFSGRDGLAAGRSIGNWVVSAFSVTADEVAPRVALAGRSAAATAAGNVSVAGSVTDNLTGVRAVEVQLGDGPFVAVPVDAAGGFAFPTALPVDGSADGRHEYRVRATDYAGNTSEPVVFTFTLDTAAPAVAVAAPADGGSLAAGARLTGTASGTGSPLAALAYSLDGGPAVPVVFDPATGAFDAALDLSRLAPGDHTLAVTAADAAGNTTSAARAVTLAARIPLTITAALPADGADEVGVTYRPKVTFSRPVDVATLTADSLYALDSSGAKLPAVITPAADGSFAWLFFAAPLAGMSTVTLVVDGSAIRAADGALLDADGDGTPGGRRTTHFRTVGRTGVPGTTITGVVADPGPDLKPMTFDDTRAGPDQTLMTADDVYLRPLAGVRVFILGMEDQTVVTDAQGRFTLAGVPAGNVKLAVDGRTATNAPAGVFFPEMVMDLQIDVGRVNTVMGSMGTREAGLAMDAVLGVYLPRLETAILQNVSPTGVTTVGVTAGSAPNLTPEQRPYLTLSVQPGSLIGPDGLPVAAGQVGISTVPAEMVREMLPPGQLQHAFDITVQAPGVTNFSVPAPMTFPNWSHAAPGTVMNFMSFDHTTGRMEVEGTATVSADGLSVTTDPGYGITHPGWHFVASGTPADGKSDPCGADKANPDDCQPAFTVTFNGREAGQFTDWLVGQGQPAIGVTITSSPADATVSWTLTPDGAYSGTVGQPAGTQKTFSFTPDVAARAALKSGNLTANDPVKYILAVTVTAANGKTLSRTETIAQDRVSTLRQEYIDFGVQLPSRGSVVDAAQTTNFSPNEFATDSNYRPLVVDGGFRQIAQNIRDAYGAAVDINSGYRNPRSNKYYGGVLNSDHQFGGAVDVDPYGAADTPPNMVRLYRVALAGSGAQNHLLERKGVQLLPKNWAPPAATHTFTVALPAGPATVTVEDSNGDDLPDRVSAVTLPPPPPGGPPAVGVPTAAGLEYDGGGTSEPPFRAVDANNNQRVDVGEQLELDYDQSEPGNHGWHPLLYYFTQATHVHADNGISAAPFGPSSAPARVPVSAVPGFGEDSRGYYAIELGNGARVVGRTDPDGRFAAVLTPSQPYTLTLYDAATNRWAVVRGVSAGSGARTEFGAVRLDRFGGQDTDEDGIPDLGEFTIGTDPVRRDTDRDGVSDDAEVAAGTDPLDGRGFPTGVIATLPLRGGAEEVVVEGATAYVAAGSGGLAVVDVGRFDRPAVSAQLPLPGFAADVAVSPRLGLAAVATGAALHVVDVADPRAPRLLRTVPLAAGRVEVVDGVAYAAVGGTLAAVDLLTGEVLATRAVAGGGTILAFAREGGHLYTIDFGRVLRVFDTTPALTPRGSLTLPTAGKLFVGNGVAYVAAADNNDGGYCTVDVRNPAAPVLLSGSDAPFSSAPGTAVVANGSGVGLLVGRSVRVAGGPASAQLVRTTDPTNTYDLLLDIPLPATPRAVTLASGIAFVAGANGLTVVNYLPFDSRGQGPTVALSTPAADVDPADGLQVIEGTAVPFRAAITDDVQVRNVELLVDGAAVANDVSFPFEFVALAPAGRGTQTYQLRATDTGGNVALSAPLAVGFVPERTPPTVAGSAPAGGAAAPEGLRTVRVRFSEPMAAATLSAQTLRLADGAGTAFAPEDVQLLDDDREVKLTFAALPAGEYSLTIDPAVTDRAGNALGAAAVARFTLVAPNALTVVTTTADDGPGSLRAALIAANASATPVLIDFQIPATDPNFVDIDSATGGDAAPDVFVIPVRSPLPALTNTRAGVRLDARTQTAFGGDTNPAGPEVVLDGAAAGAGADGVRVLTAGHLVAGLNIQRFGGSGVAVVGAAGTRLHANSVGTDPSGRLDRGNTGDGVRVSDGAVGTVVGTDGDGVDDAAEGNTIAFNRKGVVVVGADTARTTIRRNNIFRNQNFPWIDLGDDGTTANDPGDADAGPNGRQNAPVLLVPLTDRPGASGTARMTGELVAAPAAAYTLDYYRYQYNAPGGPVVTWFGAVAVTTDAAGRAAFTHLFTTPLVVDDLVYVTATDPAGNTSEFDSEYAEVVSTREPNDTLATAYSTNLSHARPGLFESYGTIGNKNMAEPAGLDVDFSSVVLAAGDRLMVDVDPYLSAETDTVLRLFDSTGRELDAVDDAPAPEEAAGKSPYLEYTAPAAGTYTFGISGKGAEDYDPRTTAGRVAGRAGYYYFTVTVTTPDPAEPGRTLATARDLGDQLPADLPGYIGDNPAGDPRQDIDLYALALPADTTVRVDLDALQLPGGSTLRARLVVFDESGNIVEASYVDDRTAPGEQPSDDPYLEFTAWFGGTYYIGVSCDSGNSYDPVTGGGQGPFPEDVGRYTLTVTTFTRGDLEENDTAFSALASGIAGDGAFYLPGVLGNKPSGDYLSDVDFVRFEAYGGGRVVADIDSPSNFGASDTLLVLFWYDDWTGGFVEVARSDDDPGPGEWPSTPESYLDYTVEDGGAYYLAVCGAGNEPDPWSGGTAPGFAGDYDLTLTVTSAD